MYQKVLVLLSLIEFFISINPSAVVNSWINGFEKKNSAKLINLTENIANNVEISCRKRYSNLQIIDFNEKDISEKIDLSKDVTFIIHGWMSSGNADWIQRLLKDYEQFVDTNICVVNWEHLASNDYDVVVQNAVPNVGAFVSNFIIQHNISLESVNIVGHSLGAHVAGFAGQNLEGKIFLIVGLDPAGPDYTLPNDFGPSNRLDDKDAQFVQTIVTTQGLIGSGFGLGGQNFFPNGGNYPQPGCSVTDTHSDVLSLNSFVCSHEISCEYFRLSLNPGNNFIGVLCPSRKDYYSGSCSNGFQEKMKLLAHGDVFVKGDFFLKIDKSLIGGFLYAFKKMYAGIKDAISGIFDGLGSIFN